MSWLLRFRTGVGICTPVPNLPNLAAVEPNGPTGVIFSLTLDYELPDVVWQPPVTNLESSGRKNGSTLPLKFRFYTQDGKLIKQPQQVYLAVHEGGFADPEDELDELGEASPNGTWATVSGI